MNEEFRSRLKNAFVWTMATVIVSFLFTLMMIYFEWGENPGFKTWNDIVWWWIVTISGLGYGDVLPITAWGRVFGGVVIATSLVLFAIVVSEIAAIIKLFYEHKEMGIIRVNYSGHVVIYGYTSLSAGVIKLLRRHFGKDLKIVLISNDIDRNPFPDQVDFIYANPITRSTFREANTKDAAAAIILANDRFNNPDAYSLVIASGIERDNARVTTLVELVSDDMKDLFKEGNIDAFIDRKVLLRDLLENNDDPKLIRIINKQTNLDDKVEEDESVELI